MRSETYVTANYPVMLNLTGKRCVVVGGGYVAARKIQDLLDAGGIVTVISPTLVSEIRQLVEQNQIEWVESKFVAGMLEASQPFLVFAATNNSNVNQLVAEESFRIGALVNVVDGSSESDFSNMSVIKHPPLTIGISTTGASPALTRYLRTIIEEVVGEEYATLAQWLSDLRLGLDQYLPEQADRKRLYDKILSSDVLPLLREHQTQAAFQHFQDLVQSERVLS